MKTLDDIYWEVGIPCVHCKYLYSNHCNAFCINPTLNYMFEIADEMILRGEY